MSKHFLKTIASLSIAAASVQGINVVVNDLATRKKLNEQRVGAYFPWKYGDIFYTENGQGNPVLLIHDLHPDNSSIEWSKIIPLMKDSAKVFAFDLLGCGNSDKPNITYTNYMYVQLIENFIKNVIKEKTNIVVTGDSVPFAIMAKKTSPELIGKIIAINPTDLRKQVKLPNKNSKLAADFLGLPVAGPFIYNVINRKDETDFLFNRKYFYNKELVTDELKDYYYESAHYKNSQGRFLLASIAGRYTNLDIRKTLKETKDFIILASRNRAQSTFITNEYIKINPKVEVSYLSGTKLLPQLETPDKTFNRIMRYL